MKEDILNSQLIILASTLFLLGVVYMLENLIARAVGPCSFLRKRWRSLLLMLCCIATGISIICVHYMIP